MRNMQDLHYARVIFKRLSWQRTQTDNIRGVLTSVSHPSDQEREKEIKTKRDRDQKKQKKMASQPGKRGYKEVHTVCGKKSAKRSQSKGQRLE